MCVKVVGGWGITLTFVSQICFSQQVRYTQCQSWIYSKKGENAPYLFAHITFTYIHFSKHHQNSWCSFPWLPLGCMEPLLMWNLLSGALKDQCTQRFKTDECISTAHIKAEQIFCRNAIFRATDKLLSDLAIMQMGETSYLQASYKRVCHDFEKNWYATLTDWPELQYKHSHVMANDSQTFISDALNGTWCPRPRPVLTQIWCRCTDALH